MRHVVAIEDFTELTALSAAAALEPALWQRFTDRLSVVAGGFPVHLLAFGNDEHEIGQVATGYDPAWLGSYVEHYAAMNAWAPTFLTFAEGEVVDSRKMCPDRDLQRTEFYNEWVKPQDDISLGGGAMIAKGAEGSLLVGGNVPRRMGDDAVARWLALVALLVPHLQAAWRTARTLTALSLAGKELPTVVTAPDGRVVFFAGGAERLVEQGTPLGVDRNGKLLFVDPTDRRWWRECLRGRPVLGERRIGGFLARATSVGPELLARHWPLALFGLPETGICLTLSPSRTRPDASTGWAQPFGLTDAECDVAEAIARGATPQEIADVRQVSIHTVRNQIRSARDKAGVRTVAALADLAAQGLVH